MMRIEHYYCNIQLYVSNILKIYKVVLWYSNEPIPITLKGVNYHNQYMLLKIYVFHLQKPVESSACTWMYNVPFRNIHRPYFTEFIVTTTNELFRKAINGI